MLVKRSHTKIAAGISILFFISMVIIARTCEGTGDEGDSVMHFLYSKWAFRHPRHFLDHWAKPMYVLITCIPAQFGFFGIQLFNISLGAISIFLTFRVAQKLNIQHAWLASLFLAIFPHEVMYSLSGLTEPLFAFILILVIFLWLFEYKVSSMLILSFLPFIRSEGMVVIVVFFVYLLIKKEFKYIPLLIIGHVVYTIVGVLAGKPIGWVFTENPYAMWQSNYGKGPWNSFILNIRYTLGIAMYFVLWSGMILGLGYAVLKFIFKKNIRFSIEELFLIYGIFFSYFVFHSVAWYKGWFHSFGMIRVMIGVLPCAAIICAKVFDEALHNFSERSFARMCVFALVILLIAINFTCSRYRIHKVRDLSLRGDQKCQQQVIGYMEKNFPEYKKYPIYFTAPYLSELLNIDLFDDTKRPNLWEDYHNNTMKKPSYLIWDDWFCPVEQDVKYDDISKRPDFIKVKEFSHYDTWGDKERKTIVYKIQ
jgi:hypothetical protein